MGSSVKIFKLFKDGCNTLIETGTWTGDGIQCALDAGYKKIYSCDINQEMVKKAHDRFHDKDVTILLNPSKIALKQILDNITEKCVIFLDGHSMPLDQSDQNMGFGAGTVKEGLSACPLLDELEIIKTHSIKNHIIMIDDYQCFNTWIFDGLRFEQVLEKISQINPHYNHMIWGNVVIFKVGGFKKKIIADKFFNLCHYLKAHLINNKQVSI